jgi:hypothetical protein
MKDSQRRAMFAKSKNKPLYEITYSDKTKAIVPYKVSAGKAKGEAGEMDLRYVKVKKISNPTFMQRLKSW